MTKSTGDRLPTTRIDFEELSRVVRGAVGVMLDPPERLVVAGEQDDVREFSVARRPLIGELEAFAASLDGELIDRDVIVSRLTGAEIDARTREMPGFSRAQSWRLSITQMLQPHSVVTVDVAADCTAEFLNDVGRRTADAGLDDVQLRTAYEEPQSPGELVISGFVTDVDTEVDDPAMEPFHQHAPIPVAAFSTENGGARFVYAFCRAVPFDDESMRERLASFVDVVALTFAGFDDASADPGKRQYLPVVLRTTKGSRRRVDRVAVQVATRPLDLATFAPRIPRRVLALLGLEDPNISDAERDEVEAYLASIGIPAAGSSTLYSRCPRKSHDGRKTYVNVSKDGRIRVFCLGGHDGDGQLQWSEHELLALAREVAS